MKNIEKRNSAKPYRVRICIKGKKLCKSFKTRAEADTQLALWRQQSMFNVTAKDVAELILCKNKLGNASLTQAVDFYLSKHPPENCPTIAQAFDQYLQYLKDKKRTSKYISSTSSQLKGFLKKFSDMPASTLTNDDVSSWIAEEIATGVAPRTIFNRFNAARVFAGWLKWKKWLRDMPDFDDRELPKMVVKEPEYNTAAETAAIFDALERNFPEAIPFFAVRAFFGLRTSEARRMSWEDVDLDAEILRVRATKSKLGIARTLDAEIAPRTAFVWLRAYKEYPFNVSEALASRVSHAVGGIKHNVFRKTFATMLTSLTRNQHATMLATGHTSLGTLKRHYEAAKQTKAEAEAYFAVLPKLRPAQ